jgi:hypothetical protein
MAKEDNIEMQGTVLETLPNTFKYGALHFNIVFFGHLVLWGITTVVLNRQDNAEVQGE